MIFISLPWWQGKADTAIPILGKIFFLPLIILYYSVCCVIFNSNLKALPIAARASSNDWAEPLGWTAGQKDLCALKSILEPIECWLSPSRRVELLSSAVGIQNSSSRGTLTLVCQPNVDVKFCSFQLKCFCTAYSSGNDKKLSSRHFVLSFVIQLYRLM